jgi:hypothetical protein
MKSVKQGIPPTLDQSQRFIVDEAARYLRIAASTTWLRIREGKIQVIREGGRTFVPGTEIARLSRLPE